MGDLANVQMHLKRLDSISFSGTEQFNEWKTTIVAYKPKKG